jgi:FAD/FMN-containing dehydrogenase
VKNHKQQLIEIVGRNNVFDEPQILDEYARDQSFALSIKPALVVKPENAQAVQQIVQWANRMQTPLVPVSSGPPHFRGDTVPGAAGAVIVDLSGMNRILRMDRRNRITIVEPGVTYSQLQPELAREGLRLTSPLLPRANKSVVASLLEREPTLVPRYQWATLDPLRCLEVVWGDGERFTTGEVAKPGALETEWEMKMAQVAPEGPAQVDYYRLVSAAQGSMGIVTWASIKCEVLPELHKLFFVSAQRLADLIEFAYRLLRLRFGDELLLLNRANLAAILEPEAGKIRTLTKTLPPWILLVGVAGRSILPRERVAFQEKDMTDIAQQHGLQFLPVIAGTPGDEVLNVLLNPSREPGWKIEAKGACQDFFFLTTLDRTPEFIATMHAVAESHEYPVSHMGIYIQPLHQGVSCHCEFNLPFDPTDAAESHRIQKLLVKASRELMHQGAYFSRPYGIWADMAFNRDAQTTLVLKKVKKIFDPKAVMNPGKLCF